MKPDLRLVVGVTLVLLGLGLALVPRYVPRPGAEPVLAGTYWHVGLPVALVGAALVLWARRRPRPSA